MEDELARLLPPAPADRPLPNQPTHKADLLAAIAAERTQGQAFRRTLAWRRPAANRWLVPAGAAIAVSAIVLAAVTLSGAERQHPSSRLGAAQSSQPATGPSGSPSVTRHWQVASAGLRGVVVRTASGSVTVAGDGGGPVSVTAQPHYRGAAPTITRVVRHGVLTVSALCPNEKNQVCSVPVGISLPSGLPVRVSTDVGSVSVSHMTGSVKVTDALGSIDLSGLSGSVTAADDDGNIVGHSLDSTRVNLSAQLGAIRVAFLVAPDLVDATDQDGPVAITVPVSGSYRVTANTQLGSVTVTVPRSARSAHVINASSQLGSVRVTG